LPRPEHVELAKLFLRKAASDLNAARTLAADIDQLDDVVGFHLQQVVEKSFKAALAVSAVKVRATHDLNFLVDVLKENGIEPPEPLSDADWLVPWAVSARYDEDVEVLDRNEALAFATSAFEWATARVASSHAED
jgi:HEPN domain-containing protein